MRCLIITSYGKEGHGHLTRCIAISQALQKKKIKCFFLLNKNNKDISQKKIVGIFNWYKCEKRTLEIVKNYDFIIVDSIKINKDYLIRIKNIKKTIYINDYHRWKIRNLISIDWTLFIKQTSSKLGIFGHKFCALRKSFWKNNNKILRKEIKNIVIFFGGADIHKLSTKVAKLIINSYKNYKINLVSTKNVNNKNIIYNNYLSEKKMKLLLQKSDIIITSGGQTLYEMACVGIPGIILSETKYDRDDINAWKKKGSIIYAGKWNDKNINNRILASLEKIKSKKIRQSLSNKGKSIIDGKGAIRLANKIKNYVK
jgi:UDP-2,4-diacetamido-2,4,6-trideoxy-beta-L-altropyranose hydrolase